MKKSRGRPAIWRENIVDYVMSNGPVSVRDLRVALGMPESSAFHVVNSLVLAGELVWQNSVSGRGRLLKTTKTLPKSLNFLAHLGY